MQLNTGEQALKSLHLRLLMSWRVVGGGIKTQECLLLIKNNKKKATSIKQEEAFRSENAESSTFAHA